mmetsp:Transcript_14492/g.31938  ORF Transcript_14492/g.31938 Transcript_14492/m.31938 type:complete len:99 (-) Transcript_14492:536-832(-)
MRAPDVPMGRQDGSRTTLLTALSEGSASVQSAPPFDNVAGSLSRGAVTSAHAPGVRAPGGRQSKQQLQQQQKQQQQQNQQHDQQQMDLPLVVLAGSVS